SCRNTLRVKHCGL
ncbi:hypothetical protein D029_1093B, partial [Vibrio parahaemolyticus 970107]